MEREALKMALEALENPWNAGPDGIADAITAIKEALAQPAQEPVAWEQFYPDIGKPQIALNAEVVGYVAPQRPWVGLTAEETSGFTSHEMTVVKYVSKVLQEKNHG